MNRAMIISATIAAGLHVALLGFRSLPPLEDFASDLIDTDSGEEPFKWVEPPPEVEDPVERFTSEDLPPPAPVITSGAETPTFTPTAEFTIIRPPTPEIIAPPSTLIDSNWQPPSNSRDRGVPVYTVMELQNVPRALFRHSPSRPHGTGSSTETVTVDFVVGKDGRVAQVRVVDSSDPDFEDVCLRAIKRWRFEPGMRKNVPVAFRMQQTFVFTAHD